ncbi:hypothetical protein [Cryobacterium sp. 5B3]|uniref:hypothetical protein n=1 Tax=Cryobacterium sp. 5B3 TaxID=3048586 RepID=UPI002AB56989|nr:hypothetical protein [Cryobacterium sp. 5B3]MDY7541772.1 hypothetical protein [Cryobacterium sp. 5B3]MEB0275248.1 hypothetical protein [Cryobacterium sp. 5B3]
MNITPKARVAIVVALATALLTGCSAAAPDASGSTAPTSAASATSVAQTRPESRTVTVDEVLDPMTFVVTPTKTTDALYGTKFTLHLVDFNTAVKGECGYDETLALAKKTVSTHTWIINYAVVKDGVWIDEKGDHYGMLDSSGAVYEQTMMKSGFAYLTAANADNYLLNPQREAKNAGSGLWTTCPGFGA